MTNVTGVREGALGVGDRRPSLVVEEVSCGGPWLALVPTPCGHAVVLPSGGPAPGPARKQRAALQTRAVARSPRAAWK